MTASGERASTAAAQARLWGAGARDWAEVQEGQVRPLFEAILAAVGAGPGTRLLDMGCGAGLVCMLAAQRGASVVGLDATPEMLAIAGGRVPEGDFHRGGIETLPFGDASFDAVTAVNSIQFAADPVDALSEARRVARPGAPIGIGTWGPPHRCDARVMLDATRALLPPAARDAPAPLLLSDEGVLRALLTRAGLAGGPLEEVECVWTYPDLGTAMRGMLAAGPGAMARAAVGDAVLRDALGEALEPFREASGAYRLTNVFCYVVATA